MQHIIINNLEYGLKMTIDFTATKPQQNVMFSTLFTRHCLLKGKSCLTLDIRKPLKQMRQKYSLFINHLINSCA